MNGRARRCGIAAVLLTFRVETLISVNTPSLAFAQSASVSGIVSDTMGQALPGVFVTIVEESGAVAVHATSDRTGAYQFDSLPEGAYRAVFDLLGFDLAGRNHILVRHDETTKVDATLRVSSVCECITILSQQALKQRAGQVVDESGRPIPYARIDVVGPMRREVRNADVDGRFRVRLPLDESWPLTASCSGFDAVTRQLSGTVAEPVTFKLPRAATQNVPVVEQFNHGCRCPGDLITNPRR